MDKYSSSDDAAYVIGRLAALRARCRGLVSARQSEDPDPEDRFRGLYVTDDQVLGYLADQPPVPAALADPDAEVAFATLEAWATERAAAGQPLRLHDMMTRFALQPLDVEILIVAAAPDLDPRLEKAYGYLHDDVTRRRASVGLALELVGASPTHPGARARLASGAPLLRAGLVMLEEPDRPFLTRSLRVPDEVVAYLLGDDALEPLLRSLATDAQPSPAGELAVLVRGLQSTETNLVYIRDRVGAAALSFAASGAKAAGLEPLVIDLDRLDPAEPAAATAAAVAVCRRARLCGKAVVAGPVEVLAERGAAAVRAFTESDATVILIGSRSWDPAWSQQVPLVLDAPDLPATLAEDLPFRLTPEQAVRARIAAQRQADAAGEPINNEFLAAGARAQNAGGLERLALRITPSATWDDLVLPNAVYAQLQEVVSRVRFRDLVLHGWGLRRGSDRGQGVTSLFAGDSGTGKTLSAEVVAGALGLDLYVVDLATVVDKYIGETEKNLDRIFREADRVNGVLLFDEADAIFGKRSEVSDARDRYANVEVAYLLQRMERFDGIAILTTNLRANLDDAFLRRLDALIDFPVPDERMRYLLWERHLPASLPRDDSVDLKFLARAFDLPGGNIRNIALAAAFLAASEGSVLTMSTLIRATAREYRKLGRLLVESEFGSYHPLLSLPGGDHVHVR